MVMQETIINIFDRYQSMLQKKYLRIDALYWDIMDEMVEKLTDKGYTVDAKQFTIKDYDFLEDWEIGNISSSEVYDIIKSWNPEEIAYLSTCRKIKNYVHKEPGARDIVNDAVSEIQKKITPEFIKYIETMVRFFAKLNEEDKKQVPVTWLEVRVKPDDERRTSADDLTLNQTIRMIDSYVLKYADSMYYLGDHIVCFNEERDIDGMIKNHWIFAPKGYIDIIKSTYNIKEALDPKDDLDYIKGLVRGYLND